MDLYGPSLDFFRLIFDLMYSLQPKKGLGKRENLYRSRIHSQVICGSTLSNVRKQYIIDLGWDSHISFTFFTPLKVSKCMSSFNINKTHL